MSDYPPPDTNTAGERPTDTHDPNRKWKTWQLAAASALALFIGIGMGGAGAETADSDPAAAPGPAETVTVTETVRAQEGEPAPAETVTVTAQPAEPPAEPAAETPADTGPDGSYQAAGYTFSDVQVSEDFAGDFEVRARGTNGGDSRQGVCLSISIFSGGSVVGTADACVQNWGAGETKTVEFISSDDYQEWDELEFQIDTEF